MQFLGSRQAQVSGERPASFHGCSEMD